MLDPKTSEKILELRISAIHSVRLAISVFSFACMSASTGQASFQHPSGTDALLHDLGASRNAASLRHHVTQSEQLAEADTSLDSMDEAQSKAANAESSIQSLLSHSLDAARAATVVRRHETQDKYSAEVVANSESSIQFLLRHSLDASRSATVVRRQEIQDRKLAEPIANGENSIQSPLPHSNTLDVSRPASVVRRHETQNKHVAEVVANGESSIHSLLSHTLDTSRTAPMVRRHETQYTRIAEVAANGESSIHSRPPAMVRRHEAQGEHRAKAKEPIDVMRSRRVAVVVASNDYSEAPDSALTAVGEDPSSTSPLNARLESREHVSRPILDSPETTIVDFERYYGTSSPREETQGQVPRRDEARFAFHAEQYAPLQDALYELRHIEAQFGKHIRIKGLEKSSNMTLPPLAHSLRAATDALTSRSMLVSPILATQTARTSVATPERASIVAPVVLKPNMAGLGTLLGARSAMPQVETTTAPGTTNGPALETPAAPSPAKPAPDQASIEWKLFTFVFFALLILLCGACIRYNFSSIDNCSDRVTRSASSGSRFRTANSIRLLPGARAAPPARFARLKSSGHSGLDEQLTDSLSKDPSPSPTNRARELIDKG